MHDKYYAVLDTNVLVSALLGASHMSNPTEVSLSKDGSFLVTGNIKHFPIKPFIVTPAEMVKIMERYSKNSL